MESGDNDLGVSFNKNDVAFQFYPVSINYFLIIASELIPSTLFCGIRVSTFLHPQRKEGEDGSALHFYFTSMYLSLGFPPESLR